MNYSDITVILPTLNEEEAIKEILSNITSLFRDIKIIVADDGSTDKTREAVRYFSRENKNIILLDRTYKQPHGITASVIDAALLVKTGYFVVMDADLQHPPVKIKEIYAKLAQGADVVIAVRVKLPKSWSKYRAFQSKTANFLASARLALVGIKTKDPISGFFGGKADLFKNTILTKEKYFIKEGYKILFDYLKLLPRGTAIGIVEYEFVPRFKGKSKIRNKHIFYFIKSLFKCMCIAS